MIVLAIRRAALLLLLAGCFLAGVAPAQEKPSTALEIFDSAMARAAERQQKYRAWQYYTTLTTRQYDDDGGVIGRGTWRMLNRPGEKPSFRVLSEARDGKLTFIEDKPEGKKDGKGGGDGGGGSVGGDDDPEKNLSVVEAAKKYGLRDRYTWTRLPDATVQGERAWVIGFEPRPGAPAKGKEERFFNQLGGTIWVSQSDSSALRMTASLRSPYRLFWIIARLTELELTYDLLPGRGDPLLRLSRGTAKSTVSIPFNTVRQRHWIAVEKFEPRMGRKE